MSKVKEQYLDDIQQQITDSEMAITSAYQVGYNKGYIAGIERQKRLQEEEITDFIDSLPEAESNEEFAPPLPMIIGGSHIMKGYFISDRRLTKGTYKIEGQDFNIEITDSLPTIDKKYGHGYKNTLTDIHSWIPVEYTGSFIFKIEKDDE